MPERIAISIGDYNGIGPEVVLKTLYQAGSSDHSTPVIVGHPRIIDFYRKELDLPLQYSTVQSAVAIKDGKINVLQCIPAEMIDIQPGIITAEAGRAAMMAVEQALELCRAGTADAMVTASISKEAVNLAGYSIPGHTEFLAEKTGTDDFIMMMVNEDLRIGLLTTHLPLAEAAGCVSKNRVVRYIGIINRSLTNDFCISTPRIAVLGLNPHAGDGGMIGREEIDEITPAVKEARSQGIRVEGPFPVDGFFGKRSYREFDGILAMYHDQGLIPFKTLSFGTGVNVTAGLPIIRTSPDHGTAFDIAGQGKADPESFRQAYRLALQLAQKRSAASP
ncbi:MAG: 4-hydroxythreonine-4-phosphate dehydrogenase PdxA [Balneolaceae bacterium]|nr:4-hydroxythreonine-4-phosphate dehydrogenase PdxA [Balneolaceae bacterium]